MRIFTRIFVTVFLLSSYSYTLFAQRNIDKIAISSENLWEQTSEDKLQEYQKVNRRNSPETAFYFKLDLEALKVKLENAPVRGQSSKLSPVIIEFPVSDGTFEHFRVKESPIMHPDLAAKFPMIKTYVAQGIEDPTAVMRFSITQFGLHTMTLSGNRTTNYIDPYTEDRNYYIVYDKEALGRDSYQFDCLTADGIYLPSLENNTSTARATNDSKFRTFRLAQSCNAEYGNIFAGTSNQKANIQAQMTITINRVNSIYERDLAITLEFVANNDKIIYYGATNSDPWNGEWNNTTQSVIDNTSTGIGSANYDIGHNFNTSGGGNAGCLACVCTSGQKGSGYTGSPNPTGDAFDIDYVAHEMGHQFGGYHVMNNCSRSGNGQSEVEPGSGSSIMGYAGICSPNVINNSEDHFNYVNVRDISANVKNGNSTCAQLTTIANQPPTADAGNNMVIPKSTAFILEGIGNDPDGTASLTYEWSQNDPENGGSGSPTSTRTSGPMYRARKPVAVPFRYMPRASDIIAGNLTPTWEVTPSVSRNMEFSFMVRDNSAEGGQTADDLMTVTVDGNTGPFVVTSQSSVVTWTAGETQTITWNVAGTTGGSVNCANVDIFLFTNSSLTNPIPVILGVPNDGSQDITVPSGAATTQGRIMVRGAGNIFFDINNAYIKVLESEFVLLPAESTKEMCEGSSNTISYDVTYSTNSFNETTTFSATGLPAGVSASFSPPSTSTGGTNVQVSLTGVSSLTPGSYTFTMIGTATSVTKTVDLNLTILGGTLTTTNLSSPSNGATGISNPVAFSWADVGAGTLYDIDIALDAAFNTIVEQATSLTTNSYTSTSLGTGTQYYWRVRSFNTCTDAGYSAIFSFATMNCTDITYTFSTDCWGYESYWELQDADNGGAVLYAAGNPNVPPGGGKNQNWDGSEPGALASQSTYTYQYCLQDGCYDLVIWDDWGDGVAGTSSGCAVDGNYSVADGSQTYVQMGAPNFGNSVIENFCIQSCAVVISSTITDVSCNGDTDGGIQIAASGGNAPYSYAWSPSGMGTSISNQAPGTWTVTVTDQANCTQTKTMTIGEPDVINPTYGTNSPSCVGYSDGSTSNALILGGNGGFTYAWSNGSISQNITNVTAGIYTATITDKNGCKGTRSVTITDPNSIGLSISTTDQLCGSPSGTATVIASGGAGNFAYLWQNNQTTATATGLTSTTYNVTVTDGNSCTSSTIATVVSSNPSLTVNITTTDEICGSATGSANASISDGVQPYTYIWNNSSTTSSISNLNAGGVSITVTDKNGCTGNSTATVNANSINISITMSSQDQYCGSLSGVAAATANNGTAPYSYLWNNNGTASSITGLTSGNYLVTITDDNNCTGTSSVSVSATALNISMTFNVTDKICAANGSVEAIPSNGAAPYNYIWNNSETTASITDLNPAGYSVTITDNNNCIGSGNVNISATSLNISISLNVTDKICTTDNGAVDAVPSNGTAPYSYLWNNNETTSSITGLADGNYSVTIMDANGCVGNDITSVGVIQPNMIAVVNTTEAICTSASGTASVQGYGGTTPYTYLWQNGATTSSVSGLSSGAISATVTDVNLCTTSNSSTVNTVNNNFSVSITYTDEYCNNSNGTANAIAVNTTAQTFLWISGETTSSISGLSENEYSVEVTDIYGCVAYGSVSITNIAGPSISASAIDSYCNGGTTGSVSSSVTGNGPLSYLWSNGAVTANISNVSAGSYSVTVTDVNNCGSSASALVNEPIAISVSISSTDETIMGSNDGTASATANGGYSPYYYNWSTGAATPSIYNLAPGVYTLSVEDNHGCALPQEASITIQEGSPVTSGLSEIEDHNISIFPNPTSGKFTVSTDLDGSYTLKISNVIGQDIYIGRIVGKQQYDFEYYDKGVYLITIFNEQTRYVNKVIVK